jgi:phospholipid/cholesterol/gamma-HCH transport system substrate-binding protein
VKTGADVQIAGVTVGKVRYLQLNPENQAVVGMQIQRSVIVPVDSVASVKSQGIIGDKLIQITLGGDTSVYKPGETIVDTESSVDLESLISKFAFGQVNK